MRFFDSAATGWDDRTGAGSVEHLAPIAAGVLNVAPEPERILDIGCGTGAATHFLAREFPRASVRGIDLSPAMVARATAKIGLDPDARVAFRTGDASKLPYPDQSFDLVAQINMPVFFSEISRVLRPGGTVLVAASLGDSTPFTTPEKDLRAGFARHGIERSGGGTAGAGTWFTGQKADQ
jgi:ubiquinone/menaquinone biosynthesis C-methylase UbiE